MSKWLLRGLVFAALMVIVRLLQGAMINAWETKAGLISAVLIVLFAIAVFIWGIADGRADARANPDPDRRDDLAMTWLLAGLFAGIVSGAVAWFISLFYKNLYVEALDQRGHHVRGVHRFVGVPILGRRRRAGPLAWSTVTSKSNRASITASPSPPPTRTDRHRCVRRGERETPPRRRAPRRVARSSPSRGWPGIAVPARSPALRGRRSRRWPPR